MQCNTIQCKGGQRIGNMGVYYADWWTGRASSKPCNTSTWLYIVRNTNTQHKYATLVRNTFHRNSNIALQCTISNCQLCTSATLEGTFCQKSQDNPLNYVALQLVQSLKEFHRFWGCFYMPIALWHWRREGFPKLFRIMTLALSHCTTVHQTRKQQR